MSPLRLALRTLGRDRGYATAVVCSLALGIGANVAIFSLVNTVLLRPLPYDHPQNLYAIYERIPKFSQKYPRVPVNLGHAAEWRKQCRSFSSISVLQATSLNLTGAGEPEVVTAARVSANLFATLGIRPQAGRSFFDREDRKGDDRVVLIADSLWTRRFHRDASIIGRKITLDGEPYEVVGVLPSQFQPLFPSTLGLSAGRVHRTEIFKPLGWSADDLQLELGDFNYTAIARLRPGVGAETALSELNVAQSNIARMLPEPVELRAELLPMQETIAGRVRTGLILVMSAVGAVLLVLCVNLANLSLARAAGRARDLAIRTALGAARTRITIDVLAESLLLAASGGALGIALAYGGLNALLRSAPVDLPRLAEVTVDGRVLLFALAMSVVCGLLFGILPALKSWRSQPQESLKSGATSTDGTRGVTVRDVLVGLEVGLCAVLLIVAGLLMGSFMRVMHIDKGYDVESIITAEVSLPSTSYTEARQRSEFFDRVLERANTLPGVAAAGVVSALPLRGETWIDLVGVENDPRPMFARPSVNVRLVSSGYFKALGIPLREGRLFDDSDRRRPVAIISANVAERLWPGQRNIVGRKMMHNARLVEIIGVVPDMRITSLDKQPVPILYIPHWQRSRLTASLVIRTAMNPEASANSIRRIVSDIDPQVPVAEAKTMVQVMSDSVAERRFQLLLVGVFAAAALGLAGLGIYGVVAYMVVRRRREIGIRLALGASTAIIYRMLIAEGMRPVLAGLAAGTAVAFAASRLLSALLFEMSSGDPFTYSVVLGFMGIVAVAACVVPARKATRIDPMRALRSE